MATLKELVDEAIADGVLSTEEHEYLMEIIHKDGKIDDEEREQLVRIMRLTNSGELKVVDKERDESYQRKREDVKKKLMEKLKSEKE